MVDSIFQSGLAGIQAGYANAARDVSKVIGAYQENGSGDPTEGLIGLKQDELQVEASAKVIKVGADLSGKVLDIIA